MRQDPTLIDRLFRASFSKVPINGWRANAPLRTAFSEARRFMLDDDMATFLGDLSSAAFKKSAGTPQIIRTLDHFRMGARLPHETTWIEFNLRNAMTRSHEILGQPFDPTDVPTIEGWLLQQHPQIDTAFRAHVFTNDPHEQDDGFDTWTLPFAYAWTADDETVIPWRPLPFSDRGNSQSATAIGVNGYNTDKATIAYSDLVHIPSDPTGLARLIQEWAGALRRMWALLATINDLPLRFTEIRPAKGFAARGNFRRYLSHKTITLTVPAKDHGKVARNALAMAHRRAHGVRGHWRRDWRHPLAALCEHEFRADSAHLICERCKGRKSWIPPHQRGDASKGLTLHAYQVKHDPQDGKTQT